MSTNYVDTNTQSLGDRAVCERTHLLNKTTSTSGHINSDIIFGQTIITSCSKHRSTYEGYVQDIQHLKKRENTLLLDVYKIVERLII